MKEDNWYKMLIVSALLHVFIIGAFSITLPGSKRKFDMPYYSVNLVGDIGGKAGPASIPGPAAKAEPKKEPPPPQPQKQVTKEKPVPQPEKARSIAPKASTREVTKTTKAEVKSLAERIRELKRKTQYMEVTGSRSGSADRGSGSGLPTSGSGGGGGGTNPVLQRYYFEVWEIIQSRWNAPGLSLKKNLETKVSIRIRKDGRIVDIEVDEPSGNRIYDESVNRALRSIDTLPPIPASLGDSLEIGFAFHPPAESR
jgi:TonB family protein